jgi:hypothetical protein
MHKSLSDDAQRQDHMMSFDSSMAALDSAALDSVGKTVQINSGVHIPLRGCITRDYFYLPFDLYGVHMLDSCCIQDANYVLCPVCQVVSPVGGNADNDRGKGGVGLGFTFDDIL